ncbi:TetR/AcrR family transcriptional regulator [Aldersonia sp. NBC_00410]|uniref:TetR/AcrR family transcriptional regulator n=1 Tax=Aldersonia sp. NBC_00410 TaxID=2975954 RepID=UPI002251C4C9|nr:TetR/AcrR family transcriptional regulator [Aldersonia sp. NBC_00410]MCX5046614.1 TetR/AcrR family transcriptional regulator [Aldersonia sp. NBC_00410]
MSVADASRRRRLEPDERREQILECAIGMFGDRPYSAVSTADLAQQAGVTRGLINHYFGTKRDLYLAVVRRMVDVPPFDRVTLPAGTVRERAAAGIDWLLGVIEEHGSTWVAVTGAEGVGDDPEVQRILDAADEAAAERVLALLGLTGTEHDAELLAMVRAFGGIVKAASREWITRSALTRAQVQLLLTDLLEALVTQTFPRLREN